MKYFGFLFLILVSTSTIFAGTATPTQVEAKAIALLNKIENRDSDSLRVHNNALIKLLSNELRSLESMQYPFSRLNTSKMKILKSSDGRLRIFCWDNNEGGTARSFNVIAQFYDETAIYTSVLNNAEEDEFAACSGSYYEQLKTVTTTSRTTVYLLTSRTICSSAYGVECVSAHTISGGKINPKPFFKTPKKVLNEIAIEYDFSTQENRGTNRDYPTIRFSDNANVMYIPIIEENSTITTRTLKYHFDGSYYVFKKN